MISCSDWEKLYFDEVWPNWKKNISAEVNIPDIGTYRVRVHLMNYYDPRMLTTGPAILNNFRLCFYQIPDWPPT
jgi:hypothetical protein